MPAPPPSLARRALLGLAFVALPLAGTLVLSLGPDPVALEATRPLQHRSDGFVGSNACRSCHLEHHASWERTYHRTMTQRPSAATVRGAFDGRTVEFAGAVGRTLREGERYFMDVPVAGGAAGGHERREVALVVGSRRYQQYFEREQRGEGFVFRRLPLLWHIGEQRWLPLNAVFLEPDVADWDQHRATWNDNCIFCHNTGVRPERFSTGDGASATVRFDSEVGELGISCEACHGPGAEHAAEQRSLLGRYATHFGGDQKASLVVPDELEQERSVSSCGQCHGQRLPHSVGDLQAWLVSGPSFRSGERLAEHVIPVEQDTPTVNPADPDMFRLRFWGDGTARLTAYEYQGVTASPCYVDGPMTCSSCHTMHGGDPAGMLQPAMRGDRACLQCHGEIADDLGAHTGHEPAGPGSRCLECHMPRIVYGILDLHRSHRIEVPDVRRDVEAGRPNACTLCHADRDPAWVATEMKRIWGTDGAQPRSRPDGAPLEMSDAVASLLSGDAVQRAVYAKALGRADSALPPAAKGFARVALIATLGDAYPSVRIQAQRSLLALERELPLGLAAELEAFDPLAGADERRASAQALWTRLATRAAGRLSPPPPGVPVRADHTPDLETLIRLLELQSLQVISIGE